MLTPSLSIELLGTIRVLVHGEPLPRVRSKKGLWLLALLALRGGRPIAREWLAGTLWPDADLSVGLANLRPVMSELRRALGAEGKRVEARGRSEVSLDLTDAYVDTVALDFALQRGDHVRVAELYRGSLLEGCAEEWCIQERSVREEKCLASLMTLGQGETQAGRHAEAVQLFTRAGQVDRWRDAPVQGLMSALSATGDVNAALQVYRRFAITLSREAALEPTAETRALYDELRELLRSGDRAARGESRAKTPHNLTESLTDLVGREDERVDVAARLRRSRLVTLTGMGGIGKTRLARSVAKDMLGEYPGGVWYVALDAISGGDSIPQAIGTAMGLREDSARSALSTITEKLRDRRALLVLDNCEHVIKDCAQVARELTRQCGSLSILATSREPLRITGEVIWQVPSLLFPAWPSLPPSRTTRLRVAESYDGVRFLVDRIQAFDSSFVLNAENLEEVVTLCAKLDGIPLALELAAARASSMSLKALVEHLERQLLSALSRGDREAHHRQSTMEATLDWSYALLGPEEAEVFRKGSLFVDGWNREAAEAIFGPGGLESLASLIEKSLVVFDPSQDRYRMLETVRQYAAEKLAECGSTDALLRIHRTFYSALASRAFAAKGGDEQAAWLKRLEEDHGNLLAALRGFVMDANGGLEGLQMASDLTWYWQIRGPRSEGIEFLVLALSHPGAADDSAERGRALNGAGILAFHRGDRSVAKPLFEAALAVRRRLGDARGVVASLTNVANVMMSDGEHEAAQAAYAECLTITAGAENYAGQAHTLVNVGYLAIGHLGECQRAQEAYEEALRLYRSLGDPSGESFALEGLGFVALAQAAHEEARACFEESMSIRTRLQDQDVGWSLDYLGEVALARGEMTIAREWFEQSMAHFIQTGESEGIAAVKGGLACIDLAEGHDLGAKSLFEEALLLFRGVGERRSACRTLCYLSLIEARQGNLAGAIRILSTCLAELQQIKSPLGLVVGLETCADLFCRQNRLEDAVPLWGAARRERDRTGHRRYRHEEAEQLSQLDRCRSELGETRFGELWDEGFVRSLDEAADQCLLVMEAAQGKTS